ncbi:YigZ family protein [Roseburia sp. 499]|uniref:YigZ family protein n=1 Tax=Roseburia sp. 499 TaxID=1261634 RepID=UPI000952EDFE|nr:YigZ family protein [Roseburia sp. 499]WVK70346.1 YigZ family protein [Roseburia sp. 499]
MENKPYKTLYEGGVGEIVEKKSRFIATVEKIDNEEEALAFIAKMKKQYWDARHNCYAFVAGKNHELQRCSDDGEPNGTAGRPMLEVLLREDIHNIVVVVTRYFGGTLLGTGGLVRAYQKSVQEGLRNSIIIERMQGQLLDIHTDYNGIGKIQYIVAQEGISVLDTEYTDKVVVKLIVPIEKMQKLQEAVTEGTNGNAVYQLGEMVEFASIEGKIKIF